MKPKEKAKDLVDKYIPPTNSDWDLFDIDQAKQCALIAVDEILGTFIIKTNPDFSCYEIEYWKEVKQEIEKLKF